MMNALDQFQAAWQDPETGRVYTSREGHNEIGAGISDAAAKRRYLKVVSSARSDPSFGFYDGSAFLSRGEMKSKHGVETSQELHEMQNAIDTNPLCTCGHSLLDHAIGGICETCKCPEFRMAEAANAGGETCACGHDISDHMPTEDGAQGECLKCGCKRYGEKKNANEAPAGWRVIAQYETEQEAKAHADLLLGMKVEKGPTGAFRVLAPMQHGNSGPADLPFDFPNEYGCNGCDDIKAPLNRDGYCKACASQSQQGEARNVDQSAMGFQQGMQTTTAKAEENDLPGDKANLERDVTEESAAVNLYEGQKKDAAPEVAAVLDEVIKDERDHAAKFQDALIDLPGDRESLGESTYGSRK